MTGGHGGAGAPSAGPGRGATILLAWTAAASVWSFVGCADRATWLFEVSVGGAGVVLLFALRRRFPFSGLVYLLAGLHFLILAVGAKYTYSAVPLFEWLREALGLARNHFDRVGHFAQGFVPAIIAREVFLRATPLERGTMLRIVVVSFCLAFSALYELLEWWIVVFFYPEEGPQWLGMQGDPWDAQADMFLALCGAILALLLLSRLHDRSMRKLAVRGARCGRGRGSTG